MKKPDKFGIWITQKCPLRCGFCENGDDYFKSGKIMTKDMFEDKVKDIISAGIKVVDLTPIIGEVLTVPDIGEYLDVLDQYDEIVEYTFITCLICPSKNIDAISNRPKLSLEISLYGLTPQEYHQRTNKNVYKSFVNNFKHLISVYRGDVVIINRTSNPRIKLMERDMSSIMRFLLTKCQIDEQWVDDRDNYTEVMDQKNVEQFRCHFMSEPLLTDNGICFCCMDWNKSSVIPGKITDMYGDSGEFISKIDSVSDTCNKKCGWYRPPSP